MIFTSYRWHLFILFDVIVFLFYFILNSHEAQMFQCRGQLLLLNLLMHRSFGGRGQLLLVNILRHRCCRAEVFYFVFSSEMENRTLSQICGRLYLTMFLLRVGLLTLMYTASFMALATFSPYLLIILKFFNCCCVTSNILMFKNW